MKNRIILIGSLILLGVLHAGAQQYKTLADTASLNKEYASVSNEITGLTTRLDAANNKLSNYQEKANESATDARQSASSSSVGAQNAINGTVKEARRAKRKARKSVKAAKHARSTNAEYKDQQQDIEAMTDQLNRKKDRLASLDLMRKNIMALQQPSGQ